jgi:predicted AAA+ superfamily ATPase
MYESQLHTPYNAIYHGQLSEQIVGQGLLSQAIRKNINLTYWYREQRGSISEIDFLISSHNRLIPVEVKSGKAGTLRSLHNFIDQSKNNFADIFGVNGNRKDTDSE